VQVSDAGPLDALTLAAGPGLFCEIALVQLGSAPDVRVVGHSADRDELDQLLARHKPQAVLLDADAIGAEWASWVHRLRRLHPTSRLLLVSQACSEHLIEKALRAGACGVFSKDFDLRSLHNAVRRVAAGEIWADRRTLGGLLEDLARERKRRAEEEPLTGRERDICDCVARGLRNKEIAGVLRIREKTVKNHLHNIFRKLHVESRFALGLRLLGPRPRV
jgi:two-component system nitrate/nitrite response regulator NarL